MGERTADYRYGEKILHGFAACDQPNAPLTATEVAGRLDRDEAAVRQRLDALAERGALDSRTVGGDRVWWPTGATRSGGEVHDPDDLPRAVFGEAFDAMVVADDDGRYTDANPAACDLFGLPREELLGRSIEEFAPDGFDFEAAWAEFQESDRQRGTFPLVRADGERRTVEFAATNCVLPDRHLSILRDVTDREARERELETITAIDALVGEIIQRTVAISSREELERRVVDRLVESEFYDLAWIAEPAASGVGYADVVGAGLDDDVKALLADRHVDDPDAGPAPRAYFTGELQVMRLDDAREDLPEQLSRYLDEHEHRSAIAVPLVHAGVTYEVLSVTSHRDDAFTDRERDAFETLGTVLGHAINTIETRKSLHADTLVEVEFAADLDSGFFAVASERLDCTCTLDGVVSTGDDRVLHYVRMRGTTPEAVLDLADDRADVEACRVVKEADGEFVVEVQLSTWGLGRLSDVGATARRAVANGGTVRLVVEVGSDADVSAVVDAVTSWYPDLVPVAKRQVDRPLEPTDAPATSLDDRLTDRQATALEVAYQRGYFDWPRGATAEEIADALGVSSPTLHQHLRLAERKLLDGVFESAD
jgi:PAS domain S-box-containing protein